MSLIDEKTVREAIAEAKKKGLKIVSGIWGDYKTCACPMTAVMRRPCVWAPMQNAAEALGVEVDDITAFIAGFDSPERANEFTRNAANFDLGRKFRAERDAG
jgi:hypothetical protein